ncbi:MAG: hypothetical protein CME02_06070 [Geminicoccus sp.]|nr:hypothetical protein [Geminicoccus sp.]
MTDQTPPERPTDHTRALTRPILPLIIILTVLVFVALLAFTQASRLTDFFLAQPAINGAILVVAAVSAGLIIWEVVSLSRAVRWVDGTHLGGDAASEEAAGSDGAMPQLLFPLQSIMLGKSFRSGFSAENLAIVMDAIKARNDERRDLSQYLLQLLIFLGLFGTFWGLTLTVGDIGRAIGQLNEGSASGDTGDLFRQMIQSLQNPIGSMGIAFSSSLFGLAGTIIVGFMEQQSSRAHGRFIDDLENWLYQHASVTTVPQGFGVRAGASAGAGTGAAGPSIDGDQLSALTAALTAASAPPENPGPTLESMERLDSSIAANSHRLEQVEAGLSRNHDALITALQALVAVQDNQQNLRHEEHGKLASLDMLNDTNARLNAIMESWNTRSEQYFQQAAQSQREMVKLTADIEQLLKSRDAILGLNEQLATLNREVGESARRTESAFAGLQDFLAGSETGDQLGKLLTSMDGARDELRALRAEAAKAAEAASASAAEMKAATERAAASAEKATAGKASNGKATTGKKSGQ